jgi:ATP-binding cassette subfamily F protein uup
MRGDRIGIIGPNGCGKTTLLNLLLDKIQPEQGSIKFGTNLQPVYFDQLRNILEPDKTVWENVVQGGNDTVFVNGMPKHIISYLQDFLFTSDRAKCPVKQLSGGERNRLMLARLFTQPSNVLVFDEPTNDLDAETLELLEEILLDYSGTVLVVSHDREFLNNVVTATLVFEGNGIVKEYIGGYDDWQRMKELAEPAKKSVTDKKQNTQQLDKQAPLKLSYKEKRELETTLALIEQLEKEHEELSSAMTDTSNFSRPGFLADSKSRFTAIDKELVAAYAKWEELSGRPE